MVELPQRVIHFYSKIEYALDCLGFKQIILPHVSTFNDPFDPNLVFETDFNEDFQILRDYVQQRNLEVICQEKEWIKFKKQIHDYYNKLRDSSYVFSTCEVCAYSHPKDNLYMWSHYGNGHRGIAIEFDSSLLIEAIKKETKSQSKIDIDEKQLFFKVNYQNDMPKITCKHIYEFLMHDNEDIVAVLNCQLSTKSKIWETEKEWRLWKKNDETKLNVQKDDLLDDTITAVYLGLCYQLNDNLSNDVVIFETRKNFPQAEIYRAQKRKGKIALGFERITIV